MDFDFSQNTEVSDISKVPEDFRGLYVEGEDGKYVINSGDEGVKSAVAAIQRINGALRAERAQHKDTKGRVVDLSSLSDYGDSVDEIAAGINSKLEELQGQVKGGEEVKINLEKIKADLAAAHVKDLGGKDTRIEALLGQLTAGMVDSAAKGAIAELEGDLELLLPFVRTQVKTIEEDGQFKVLVVDDAGDRRYSGATGAPMTIKELVAEMKAKEKYGKLFKSEAPRGAGTPPGVTPRRVPKFESRERSAVEKIAAGLRDRGSRR